MPFIKANYPASWQDEIRPRILKRDKFRCTRCGVKQRAFGYRSPQGKFIQTEDRQPVWNMPPGAKIIQVHLSVAHLDHDTWNNEDSNLATMCQLHHNRHDRLHRAMNRRGTKHHKT